jgi:hypothetical protein
MALAAYEAEGQQMLQQYNMLDAADTKEYSQWYDDINLQYQNVRDMVGDEYNQWSANQTMYANTANMQLAENAQIGSNLYNMYNVAATEYENAYAKDYQNWQQSVDSAYKLAGMQSTDYWKTEDMNFQKSEAERNQANWQTSFDYQKEQDKIAQSNWEAEFGFTQDQAKQSQSNWEKNYELDLVAAGAKKGDNGDVVVDSDGTTYKAPTQQILEGAKAAYANGTLDSYLEMYPEYDVVAIDNYVQSQQQFTTWEVVDNGGGKIGKVDDNAIIKDTVTGKQYTGKELYDYYIDQGMTKKEARKAVQKAQKLAGVQ